MIDNYAETMALIERMKQQLPIPALPTRATVRNMRHNKIKLSKKTYAKIESVLYMGDEGGIGCSISMPDNTVLVISLTHLKIKESHPLAKDIAVYQKNRIKKLRGSGY